MNGARTTPWEGLVHCTGTVLDMEAVEDIDEACWLTITIEKRTRNASGYPSFIHCLHSHKFTSFALLCFDLT